MPNNVLNSDWGKQCSFRRTAFPQSKSIKANDMYKKENGKWVHVWSKNKEDQIYNEIMEGTPLEGS